MATPVYHEDEPSNLIMGAMSIRRHMKEYKVSSYCDIVDPTCLQLCVCALLYVTTTRHLVLWFIVRAVETG